MPDLSDAALDETIRQVRRHREQRGKRVSDRPSEGTFGNGLTETQIAEIDDLVADVDRLVSRIVSLGRHRSYSIAITSLEEAAMWLESRKRKAP